MLPANACAPPARNSPCDALLPLGTMSAREGEEVLQAWHADAGRTLTAEQRDNVLAGFRACPQPLYLKLAVSEASRWKSYDGASALAGDIPGMITALFARLAENRHHGTVLVRSVLGLLSVSRHGLTERELLELLAADSAVMADLHDRSARSPETKALPVVIWLRLYHDLAPYLMERASVNAVLLDFYHRQVGEVARKQYL